MPSKTSITLSDGTTWPRPAIDADQDQGVEWKLRYAPGTLTRADLNHAASVLSAYGHLLVGATGERRNMVVSEVRAQMHAEEGQA